MNDGQICTVVRDLLPLYEEHLTSDETNKVIEKHLDECESCKSLYHSINKLSFQENKTEEALKDENEIDYLKKIRTSTRRKVWCGIAGVLLSIVVFIFLRLFVFGTITENYVTKIKTKEDTIIIQGEFTDSALVYSHYSVQEKNGQNYLRIYTVLPSIWNRQNSFEIKYKTEQIPENGIVMKEEKITKSGNVITALAAQIYAKRHAYIGDMSQNGALAGEIGIVENLGNFKNQLQTQTEPYGWELSFEAIWESSNEKIYNERMRGYAFILLASVENLSEVTWSYQLKTTEGIVNKAEALTVTQANEILGEDVKNFGKSEDQIEELLAKVGLIDSQIK